ncbi:MAG: hypothetical protein CME38_13735 [Haliea sp.]|nr:hypothetical protein [Haliea sp.]|tara:strand:+ start:330 stop:1184 length:855 start_codon:yes stop_codon:yes gene_type:complete
MTLNMVIDRHRIEAAQQQISRIIQSALPNIVSDKVIGFPSGSQNVQFNTLGHGRLYYVYRNIVKDVAEPRHWNTFGFYNEKKQNQDIVVETCIPKSNLNRRTAAFFVEDSASGVIYLAHDGGVGGGYTGVGKTNFRAFYPQKRLIQAFHNGKIYRDGYILGRVDSPALVERITTFAEEVADFKRFIRTPEGQSWANERRNTDSVNHQSIVESDFLSENNYNAEFSGKKKGYKIGVADYISYHGKVVHELQSLLTARNEQSKVYNDRLVDLWMERETASSPTYLK